MSATLTAARLGPDCAGLEMSLDEYLETFANGEPVPGYRYELGRGRIVVVEVPNLPHAATVARVMKLLHVWDHLHPGSIYLTLGASDHRLLIGDFDSDRHPDLSVYIDQPRAADRRLWFDWAPALAVEVVSRGSRHRDHEEKPAEYLSFGVGEMWILDRDHPDFNEPVARVLVRDGNSWRERWEAGVLTSERFPGLSVPVAEVLAPPAGV